MTRPGPAHGRPLLALLLPCLLISACPQARCDDGQDAPSHSRPCEAPPLRDVYGAVRVLRGASLSADAKWSRDRLPPFDEEHLTALERDFGMNAVRLLVFWEAIEPLPGVYDYGYLDAVARWVTQAGDRGLFVVIDMHQDVYGRGFGHAGAPYWSCDDALYASFEPQDPWFLGYLKVEVGRCFDRLYAPGPVRSAFVGAWAQLALALRDTGAETAYEILNEPFWGSTSAAQFEREVLPDLYDEVIAVVRDVDPDALFIVQPSPATNVGVPTELAAPAHAGVAYGPHFYPPQVELGTGYAGDSATLKHQLGVLCDDAERLQMPLVVGEIGVRRNVPRAERYLRDAYDALDDARASAFYWSFEQGGEQSYGMLDAAGEPSVQGRALARPFLRRVAGVPHRWRWSPNEGVFTAAWEEDGSVLGDTEVALPLLAFPHGAAVELTGGGSHTLEGGVLRIPQIGGTREIEVRRPSAVAQRGGQRKGVRENDGGAAR
jgi:endoglycosylceramidase